MSDLPLISIVTPCYNEQDNIDELYLRLRNVIAGISKYQFEIIVIDNCSRDDTAAKLRAIAAKDPQFKVIFNVRNFGHIRSPYYGLLQSRGVATIYLASDLQDPPELIPDFIRYWEAGAKLVMGVKPVAVNNSVSHALRRLYYRWLDKISDVEIIKDSTGFGLYDRQVLEQVRQINDPYPFLRGLLSELGYPVVVVPFAQPVRQRGISKNNIYTLYDIAWLGIVSHSKLPIRLAAFLGIIVGCASLLSALVFLCLKVAFWDSFPIGISPIIIGIFGLFGVQLIFLGVLGEYVGAILTYVQKRPIVIENERVNF